MLKVLRKINYEWGKVEVFFSDLSTLHEFVVMMVAILGFIFDMAPTAITLKFFSLSAIKAAIRKYSEFFVQGLG
jgi:hypothetical protein